MLSIFPRLKFKQFVVITLMAGSSPLMLIGFAQESTQACESLQIPHLEKTDLLSTSWVMAGTYTLPKPYPNAKTMEVQLSAHCIVKLAAHPSADGDIRVELWLPETSSWNGKLSLGERRLFEQSRLRPDGRGNGEAMPSEARTLGIKETICRSELGTRRRSEIGHTAAHLGANRRRNSLRLLRPSGGTRLFRGMFHWWTAGAQRGAALSR